jgi:hypothetical protein
VAQTPDIELGVSITRALEKITVMGELMGISSDVFDEFWRARGLHGDQTDRPLGMGALESYLNDLAFATGGRQPIQLNLLPNNLAADQAKALCQSRESTWADIVGEEFFEMLAESDPAKVETEAIQTIAMLLNVILAARKVASAES